MSNIVLKITNFSRQKIEFLVLLVGVLLLYVLTQIGYWSIAIPVSGIVVGAILSIILNLFEKEPVEMKPSMGSAEVDYKVSIIIASAYISSIIILYRFHSYQKPILHYVIFGAYTGYIGYGILTNQSRARILPQIMILCFFTYWSNQFAFPAGAFMGDTIGEYIPIINQQLSQSSPKFEVIYQSLGAMNLSYIASFKLITSLETFTAYALLATLILTGTVLVISLLSYAVPRVSRQTILFAALIFASSSWMIGRGMRPNKLNFFYALLVLLGVCFISLIHTSNRPLDRRWGILGILVGTALIFGHRFSAGAGMFLLLSIAAFVFLRRTVFAGEYPELNAAYGMGFIFAYIIGIAGNPIHGDALIGRLSSTILSLIAPAATYGGSAGGPGRYSTFQLDVLAISTASQALLFMLVILGFIWAYRQSKWEYDLVTVWVVLISVLLVYSVVRNTVDLVPQRFYSLLVLFGFNLFVGVAFRYRGNQIPSFSRKGLIVSVLVILAVTSLASPIANKSTSPVSDDIPHFPRYNIEQYDQGSSWTQQYSEIEVGYPPVQQTGPTTGVINTSRMENSHQYIYSEQRMTHAGVATQGGRGLGDRVLVFVSKPSFESEVVIYSNGDTSVVANQSY